MDINKVKWDEQEFGAYTRDDYYYIPMHTGFGYMALLDLVDAYNEVYK